MKNIRRCIYIMSALIVCLSLCACCNCITTETKPFLVNGEEVGTCTFEYFENNLYKFTQKDTSGNELFVIKNIDGYTMSGGEVDVFNPNKLSVYLSKPGDNGNILESIEYLFVDGKINNRTVLKPGINVFSEVTQYKDNGEVLFTRTVSEDNANGGVWLNYGTSVLEVTANNNIAVIWYYNEDSGELLSYKKYLYNTDDNVCLGYVSYDANGKKLSTFNEEFIYKYADQDDKTVQLFDYTGTSYGYVRYYNGYIDKFKNY